MELWSIGVLIIGIAVFLAAIALVPALLQLKRTLKSAEQFIDNMDASVKTLIYDEMKPLLKSVTNTIDELEGIARNAKEGVAKIDEALEAFRGLGDTIRTVNNIIDVKVKGALIDLVANLVGLKAGIWAFLGYVNPLKKKEVA